MEGDWPFADEPWLWFSAADAERLLRLDYAAQVKEMTAFMTPEGFEHFRCPQRFRVCLHPISSRRVPWADRRDQHYIDGDDQTADVKLPSTARSARPGSRSDLAIAGEEAATDNRSMSIGLEQVLDGTLSGRAELSNVHSLAQPMENDMDPILIYSAVTAANQNRPHATDRRTAQTPVPTFSRSWRRSVALTLHRLARWLEPAPSWSADRRGSIPAT